MLLISHWDHFHWDAYRVHVLEITMFSWNIKCFQWPLTHCISMYTWRETETEDKPVTKMFRFGYRKLICHQKNCMPHISRMASFPDFIEVQLRLLKNIFHSQNFYEKIIFNLVKWLFHRKFIDILEKYKTKIIKVIYISFIIWNTNSL